MDSTSQVNWTLFIASWLENTHHMCRLHGVQMWDRSSARGHSLNRKDPVEPQLGILPLQLEPGVERVVGVSRACPHRSSPLGDSISMTQRPASMYYTTLGKHPLLATSSLIVRQNTA